MRIFISYASDQRRTAEEIRLALLAQAHRVYLDSHDLPLTSPVHESLRREVQSAGLLIFLVSSASVADGCYPWTELKLFEERFPSPVGRVLPVLVDDTPLAALPPYLRAVPLLRPRGNVAAEVAGELARIRRRRTRARLGLVGVTVSVVVLVGILGHGWPVSVSESDAGVPFDAGVPLDAGSVVVIPGHAPCKLYQENGTWLEHSCSPVTRDHELEGEDLERYRLLPRFEHCQHIRLYECGE